MLDRNSLITITTEAVLDSDVNDLPLKRRRIQQNIELNGCYCGSVLDSSDTDVIECKRIGCETKWVRTYYY